MCILPNSISDHKPIKLELLPLLDLGPIPFRFNPNWIKEPDFMQLVKDCWNQSIKGSPFFIWEEKLERVKRALKHWAKSLPKPDTERKNIKVSLANHQSHMEESPITKDLLHQEAHLQQHYNKACLAEEEYWRLKSRSLWLKSGNRNTTFFHKQAQSRKCYNTISEIKVDNETFKEFANIKKAAHAHFLKLYSEEKVQHHASNLLETIPATISPSMNETLEAKITKDEVRKALYDMDLDKAPGPDGFTARFLQSCWPIIEKDLIKMIRKSQNSQKIGGSTNSAFLALIPKEKGASNFSRFQPISLCNIGYNLITKVIANRLKHILPKIIPENQGGFIQGRQIADNFTLVQEAIHSSLHRKEQGVPSLPSAFCHSSISSQFPPRKKMQDQDLMGLRIARCVKNINHTLFADDTLLLGAASLSTASKFKAVLEEFSMASGSVINKNKSHIFSWNTLPRLLSDISRCLGFATSASWTSFKYLGLPVVHKRISSKDWLPELKKFQAKIQAWGFTWLNYAGKSVLIKSVLTSLPIFQFACMLAPSIILKKMDEHIRRFFWKGGKQNERKIPLISWEAISKTLWGGGLNFKSLGHMNVAMATKVIWRVVVTNPGWAQTALRKRYL
eukprot:PITA_23602